MKKFIRQKLESPAGLKKGALNALKGSFPLKKWIIVLFVAGLLCSCATTKSSVNYEVPGPESTVDEFVKWADQAKELKDYEKALFYYDLLIVRFPMEAAQIVAAEYERGYLYLQMGEKEKARKQFEYVVEKYETDPMASSFPSGYKSLALRMLEKM